MKVEQIAIFLENRSGRLAEITGILAEKGINIRAMSLADTSDFGILRLIVNDTENARKVLKENGFTVGTTSVVVVEVKDKPGGLANVLQIIKKADLNIEYMYAFTQKSGETGLIIFRFEKIDAAIDVLVKAGIRLLSGEEVYAI
ncbi:MAG: ACT domain-containing protein [Proteobacteria bacterium]|nr:ACT domain-containing protein [Pseudomonadota bacterium]MBU4297293.1 ACT domain-containing protein [Pseudomonadota bacterium]MCG2747727.1 ACT domain-containing protein [Desulfobulbaceae bacterium]